MVDVYKRRIRAVIYCRISLAMHGDTVKVKRQEKICRKLAARLGWDVVFVFCDNNKSAWKRNRSRPDWDAMLAMVERGEVDAIIFYHGDRLIRQPWDLEILLNLADGKGLRLASPTTSRNLDDADDRYRLRQDVAKACNESDTISRRTRDAHADRAAKGKMKKGGYRPFGYKRSGKIHDEEAAEYRAAAARVLAGESKTSILRDWTRRGILTTPGNAWTLKAFGKMLRNPRYAALSVYKGEVVGKGKWKPLIERETWEALQTACGARAEQFGPAVPVSASKYLLTGIAVHRACGSTVGVFHGAGGKPLSYRCSNLECEQRVRRNMENLDAFVSGAVLTRLADPRLWAELAANRSDGSAVAELEALEKRRQEAQEEFAESDTMSPLELSAVLRRLDERIAAARSRLASQRAVHVLDGCQNMSREQWAALPINRRRAIVRATVTVELLPSRRGRGFDSSSVVIERKPLGLRLVLGTEKAAVGK